MRVPSSGREEIWLLTLIKITGMINVSEMRDRVDPDIPSDGKELRRILN